MTADEGRCDVVFIIARLNIGGPAVHLGLLGEGLAARGVRCRLISGVESPTEGSMADWVAARGLPPVVLASLGREIRPLADLRALWSMVRLLRRWRPRVVHTHTAKAGTLGRIAALLAGVPVRVHTVHGHTFRGYFGRAKTYLFLTIERVLARVSGAVIGVSGRVGEDLRALRVVPPRRLRVIPLGLELTAFREAALAPLRGALRAELGVPAGAPLLGIVARLVPIKRHDLLLEAWSRVAAQHPEARLVLVGKGELEPQLRARAAEISGGERVLFAGWRDAMPPVLADLDAVVLCSDNEGLPTALIEARAAGLPVVATDVGGAAELIGQRGLVPPGDPAALAAALDALLADLPAARAHAASIREEAFARYGADRQADDMLALYRELGLR